MKDINIKSFNRDYGIDLFRIVSMIFVVKLHVLGNGGVLSNTEWMSSQYIVSWLLEMCAYCAVDCFALISGYVGLKSDFKWSRILNIIFQVLFYSILITLLFSIFMPDKVTITLWIKAIFPITTTRYWYISAYVGMFIFIPFLNCIVNKMKRNQLRMFFGLIIVFFGILPSILQQNAYGLNQGYSMIWLCIVYLIGAYISKYNIKNEISKKKAITIYIISVVVTMLSKIIIELLTNRLFGVPKYGGTFLNYSSPTIIACSLGLLFLFANIKIKSKKLIKIIKTLSSVVLGVYIIYCYPLVYDNIIYNCATSLANNNPFMIVLKVLIYALTIYIFCSLIDYIRLKIFKLLRINSISEKIEKKLKTKNIY